MLMVSSLSSQGIPGGSRHLIRCNLGGGIERWEDPTFRRCFEDILNGNWRKHDPFALEFRLNARSSLYGRPGQATVFRTFQGWLALRCAALHLRMCKV